MPGRVEPALHPLDVLTNPLRRAILEVVRTRGPMRLRELSRLTASPSTLDWHLRKLRQAGFLIVFQQDDERWLRATRQALVPAKRPPAEGL